jgi:2-oxoisovalerate dehydrogenase E1 component
MLVPIDEPFVEQARRLASGAAVPGIDPGLLLALFDAQIQSRHLDLAAPAAGTG